MLLLNSHQHPLQTSRECYRFLITMITNTKFKANDERSATIHAQECMEMGQSRQVIYCLIKDVAVISLVLRYSNTIPFHYIPSWRKIFFVIKEARSCSIPSGRNRELNQNLLYRNVRSSVSEYCISRDMISIFPPLPSPCPLR